MSFLRSVAAAAGSVLILTLLLIPFGHSPLRLLTILAHGSLGTSFAVSETLLKTVPLLLTALAIVVSFRAGVWNIGGEGQLIVGAIAALYGSRLTDLPILATLFALLASVGAGAAWAAIAAWLKLERNAPEVLTTILLNFVALYLLGFFVNGPLKETAARYPQSDPVSESAALQTFGSTRFHFGFVIAIAAAVTIYWLLERTIHGVRLRAVGFNPRAARFAGIDIKRQILQAMIISGGLAGLAGGIELLGVTHRLFERFATGAGYAGIAVALLGQLHPIASIASAFFFAALATGAGELQRAANVSASLSTFGQGFLMLMLLLFAAPTLTTRISGLRKLRFRPREKSAE